MAEPYISNLPGTEHAKKKERKKEGGGGGGMGREEREGGKEGRNKVLGYTHPSPEVSKAGHNCSDA